MKKTSLSILIIILLSLPVLTSVEAQTMTPAQKQQLISLIIQQINVLKAKLIEAQVADDKYLQKQEQIQASRRESEEVSKEKLRKNSSECLAVIGPRETVRAEYKTISDKLHQYSLEYLTTGQIVHHSDESQLNQRAADLAVRLSGLDGEYYSACEGIVLAPPKTTTCQWISLLNQFTCQ